MGPVPASGSHMPAHTLAHQDTPHRSRAEIALCAACFMAGKLRRRPRKTKRLHCAYSNYESPSPFLFLSLHPSRSPINISIECLHWNCRSILHWHVTHTNASNGQIKVRQRGKEGGNSWICCQCIGSN